MTSGRDIHNQSSELERVEWQLPFAEAQLTSEQRAELDRILELLQEVYRES